MVNTLILLICVRSHIHVTHRGGVSHARPHLSAPHIMCGCIMRDHDTHNTHNMLTHQHVTHYAQVMSHHLHSILHIISGWLLRRVHRVKSHASFPASKSADTIQALYLRYTSLSEFQHWQPALIAYSNSTPKSDGHLGCHQRTDDVITSHDRIAHHITGSHGAYTIQCESIPTG